jgi:Fur family ferric uptake transcriptional regulator
MERNTRQREAVLEAVERGARALSPPEILALAREAVPTLNLSTIYRQIGALQQEARVVKVLLPGQTARYEAVCGHAERDAGHHHHHFHCSGCDRVFSLHACPGSMQDLVPKGFVVESHEITLHGRCPECSRAARAPRAARA